MNQSKDFATIAEDFAMKFNFVSKMVKELDIKINSREKELEELTAERTKLYEQLPNWVRNLLRPVLEEMERELPGWACDFTMLIPTGLNRRVTAYFQRKELIGDRDPYSAENCIYIVFVPGKDKYGELFYETVESNTQFSENSKDEMNGVCKVRKQLESIEEAVQILKSQIISA